MADINQIEKRLNKLEGRVETFYADMVRINNEVHRHVTTIETRFGRNLKDQNKVNATAFKHVTALEKRFVKLDKSAKKINKIADPRLMERNTMKLVDQALKAFDQKRGKR